MLKTLPIDGEWLVHSFDYEENNGQDRYGKPLYKDAVKVSNVRVDLKNTYTRTNTEKRLISVGTIFVYSDYSSPIPEFKEDSRIIFGTNQYRINEVAKFANITDPNTFSIELSII